MSDVLRDEQINPRVLHAARLATISRVHAAVLSVFVGRCQNCDFSLEALGAKFGKTPDEMADLLGKPNKWTLNTVSDLLLAMGCEAGFRIQEVLFTGTAPSSPQEQAHG